MKRLPNVLEIMGTVRSTVDSSQMEKKAAALPEASMSVDTAKGIAKLAREIRDGSFAPVTYNEVMAFGSHLKEAFSK